MISRSCVNYLYRGGTISVGEALILQQVKHLHSARGKSSPIYMSTFSIRYDSLPDSIIQVNRCRRWNRLYHCIVAGRAALKSKKMIPSSPEEGLDVQVRQNLQL